VTQEWNFDFVHDSGLSGKKQMTEIMGGGVALFDAEGDGDLDVYCVHGGPDSAGSGDPAKSNQLYLQEGGKFVNGTAASGLGDDGYGMAVAVADIDNDGDDDVYVGNLGNDRLYENQGGGKFEDVTARAGIVADSWTSSTGFFDYDRDGFLDILVVQYVTFIDKKCTDLAGRHIYCGPLSFRAVSDIIYHNNGDGTFTDVSEQFGLNDVRCAGLGVALADFNGDGFDDIYIANDAHENHLWINQAGEGFLEQGVLLGAAYNFHGRAEAGMGVVAEDFTGDGEFDLFMTHLTEESNSFYRNMGGSRGFVDSTGRAGLAASSMQWTGFGVVAADVECDGDLDLLVMNGRVKQGNLMPDAIPAPPLDILAEPNLLYLAGDAGRYALASSRAAGMCENVEISRGIAAGDIVRDGDLDFVMTNIHGPARMFLNEAPRAGDWLIIEAYDPRLKRAAIGARVTLRKGEHSQMRQIRPCIGYLSSSEAIAHFGVPAGAGDAKLEVLWPDGRRESFAVPELNARMRVERGSGEEL
jgi:hypothetical protein